VTKITEEAKGIIVKKYLNCKTLDKINEETGFSKGSIFNTIKAWKSEIGEDIVEEIRRFKCILNQSNISINECIIGFRITNMLKQFNVIDEFERDYFDSFEDNHQLSSLSPQFDNNAPAPEFADRQHQIETNQLSGPNNNNNNNNNSSELYEFIDKIYQGCKYYDIRPDNLVNWAKNLIEFAPSLGDKFDETINNSSIDQNESQSPYKKSYTIPKVSELSTYIESKKRHHIVLKKHIKALISRKQDLKNQINKKTEQLNDLNQKENFTLQYLRWYSNLHDVLINNHNIDIKLVYGNFAKVIDDFKKYDFDPIKIINDYENMESLREEYNTFKRNINVQIHLRNDLYRQVTSLKSQVYQFDKTIKRIELLENMGFRIKELEQLLNIVMQIAVVNKIDKDIAVQKFLKDVASQYDSKLGFEATIDLLNEEKRKIEDEIPSYRVFTSTKVAATQSMDYLQRNGVTVFDIIGIELLMKAFLSGQFVFYHTKSTINANSQSKNVENNNIQDWQLFIDNLKYLKDLMVEITAKRAELNDINTQIYNKLVEKQQIDNQLTMSTSDLNSLTLKGIHFMNTLNQFSANTYANMTSTKILPMVFVNISSPKPKDSQVSESPDKDESEKK
jgi:hypothetical protein